MGSSAIVESLFPCLETLVTNGDVDTVRVKAVTACGPMILNMDQRACTGTILPLMEALVTDRSWTIRHAAVNQPFSSSRYSPRFCVVCVLSLFLCLRFRVRIAAIGSSRSQNLILFNAIHELTMNQSYSGHR